MLAVETTPAAGRQLARLRGESLVIEAGGAEAGDAVEGEYRTVHLVIRNISNHNIRIVGGTSSCSCVTTGDLPVMITSSSEMQINVRVRFTGQPGNFKHRFDFYTDAPQQIQLSGHLTGRVIESEEHR